jgi:membrane protein implicated in regulation of membrane protease activity
MGTDVLEFVYFVCFFLGLGFAILSGLLAGVFTGGGEGHVDGGAVGGPHEGHVQFSPLSPVTIATFIATFGGTGILLKRLLGWPAILHIPVAAVAAIAVAGALSWLFYKIMASTQSSSLASAEEMIGLEAEVTVPIPHGGLGEIAYTVRGARFTNPARTVDDKELPARTTVKIVKQVGNSCIVQKSQ